MIIPLPEQVDALVNEIGQFITDLIQVSDLICKHKDHYAEDLKQYQMKLQPVVEAISRAEYHGLLDLVRIFQQGLVELQGLDRSLTAGECKFIKRLPELLDDYISIPGSKLPSTVLLRYMCSTEWVRPLTEAEERNVAGKLYPETEVSLVTIETVTGNAAIPKHEEYSGEVVNLSDILQQDVVEIEVELNSETSSSEILVGAETDSDSSVICIEDLIAKNADTEDSAIDQQSDKETTQEIVEKEIVNDADSVTEIAKSRVELNEDQQELVDLIRAELAEIIDEKDDFVSALSGSEEIRLHHLENMSEQAENLSNAVSLIGFDGIARCALLISEKIKNMLDKPITDESREFFTDWPVRLFAYFHRIGEHDVVVQLMKLMNDYNLFTDYSDEAIHQLQDSLVNPVIVDEEKSQRQSVAQAEDISLVLPDDVNQELVDGLLSELPSQTEEFTTLIEQLSSADNINALDSAQRIAHTLKGAANVVGVKGIANLTHHLEDILESLAKKQQLPSAGLHDVLMRAADCLENMCEVLLGIDTPDDNAVGVMQSVLDWANAIDQGVSLTDIVETTDYAPVESNSLQSEHDTLAKPLVESEPQEHTRQDAEKQVAENLLRIPTNLADEMLRLSGENLISTSQIEDRIRHALLRQETVSQHNLALQQLSFEMEQLVDIQGITSHVSPADGYDQFDSLEMDQFHELHSVSRKLAEISADSIQFSQDIKQELAELQNLVVTQSKLQKENQELVLKTRTIPVKTIIPRLKRGIRQASRLTGKEINFTVIDNECFIDSDILNQLVEPLMHVLRNAVDHGIEMAEQRTQAGKPETGMITVAFDRKGDHVVIKVTDDGQGLDSDKILSKAVKNGLIKAKQDINQQEIYKLIMEPGFSTRDVATQVSGRGIGLDVVNVSVRELKGSIEIDSLAGKGCTFEIAIPESSFSVHSLLVRVRQYIYAISSRGVEEILSPGTGELCDLGDKTVYRVGDEVYDAIIIDALLNLPPDRRNIERGSRPVLIVREDSGARKAILIQSVLDSRDVVVKQMGQYMPRLGGTVGATILGDGSIAPVLDMPELLYEKSGMAITTTDYPVQTQVQAKQHVPYVLVVDDSLSARKSMEQFVSDLGMNVRSARDGMEAAEIISSRKPDLVLVDMEMPRMNGLELTSHLRANDETRELPVIMITSRSSDKHRNSALTKGVSHYMVKPFDEDELAVRINDSLAQAS